MRTQLYSHSELCIANDASTNPQITKILDRVALQDSRIKVVHRKMNGRVSQATNLALELVTAEFAALLDHDDLLHLPALYEMAVVPQNEDAVDAIYTDEDNIDAYGNPKPGYFSQTSRSAARLTWRRAAYQRHRGAAACSVSAIGRLASTCR